MEYGTVKTFDANKGNGFAFDSEGNDVYIPRSQQILTAGDKVAFEVEKGLADRPRTKTIRKI